MSTPSVASPNRPDRFPASAACSICCSTPSLNFSSSVADVFSNLASFCSAACSTRSEAAFTACRLAFVSNDRSRSNAAIFASRRSFPCVIRNRSASSAMISPTPCSAR